MKKHAVFIFFMYWSVALSAQSTAGITGQTDTSYSTYSAYYSSKKNHPDIQIVNEFHSALITEKKNITYCAVGKRKLLLDAFYPAQKNKTKKMAVIILHGGGWRSGTGTQHYPLAQRLAMLGYACFIPEYRLSSEALFPAGIFDAKAAIRWLRKNAKVYNIDTSKIVALGFSAGGEMAAFLGTTGNMSSFEGTDCNKDLPSYVNAVVDIDGTLSFVHTDSHEGDDSKKTSAATSWFGYAKKDKPELWEAASPLKYVSSKTPPTLFINSAVPWMHAGREDYLKVLNENNIYAAVKTFEDAPHSFCLFDPWFEPTVKCIDEFLKKIFPVKN